MNESEEKAYHVKRERLEDGGGGGGGGGSRRLLLEVIAASFLEYSLNNLMVHLSTTAPILFRSLWSPEEFILLLEERGRERERDSVLLVK
jgi:hypothetical protein